MWYVYILESLIDSKHYIGMTNDIENRLREHNSGNVAATKGRIPLRLISFIAVKNQTKAAELEQYMKSGSGRAFAAKRLL